MLIFSTILLFFLAISPLILSLGLVLFCLTSVFYLVLTHSIPTLLGLTFLLVYLGSLIIISCYVCAVLPNSASPSQESFLPHTLFVVTLFIFNGLYSFISPFYYTGVIRNINSGSIFFSSPGFFPFLLIIFLLILVLNSASSISSPCSPLRS
jgi:NADH-ubiquinone/plastoquinone oxidoreductase chain 6.